MKKDIVIFSGAGLDKESGISTFRDSNDGLWNNYKVDEVATPEGWRNDREKVLRFYNERRKELAGVVPNSAHLDLVELEKYYNVIHITQNVSDLLERAGASSVLHLHGELTKARGCLYNNKITVSDEVIDIGYGEINIGDKCPTSGSQLRPHVVWFGEYPFEIDRAYLAMRNADIVIVVGTSLQIGYTIPLIGEVGVGGRPHKIFYVDPSPMFYLTNTGLTVEYIKKQATEGIKEVTNKLINEVNYRPLPKSLTIKESLIEGLGLFATEDIEANTDMGITHVRDDEFPNGYIRLPLGGFFNHSEEPNCEVIEDGRYIRLVTINKINAGDEITAKYTLYTP